MGYSYNKKTSALFFLLMCGIILTMVIIHHRSSQSVLTLESTSGGVEKLYTVGNSLVAISPKKHIRVWNWKKLNEGSRDSYVKADQMIYLSEDKLIWTHENNSERIVVTDIQQNKQYNSFPLAYDQICKLLGLSDNGRYAAAVIVNKTDNHDSPLDYIRLDRITTDLTALSVVATMEDNGFIVPQNVAISSDGKFIAIVGKKNDKGWLTVASTEMKDIIWSIVLEDCSDLREIVFSPDNKLIYTAGSGLNVYEFEISTTKRIQKRQIRGNRITQRERQHISALSISKDGRFLAAAAEPHSNIYIWRTGRNGVYKKINPGFIVLSGLAFSPDGSKLAVSGIISNKKIKIYKITHSGR